MEFQTKVTIDQPSFSIRPFERMLFVGSCFAESIGARFREDQFRAVVNPYGVMYNPASVWHTVERFCGGVCEDDAPRTAVITLGTNHVYILKETGEIVDNCMKRPQRLFREEELTVEQCLGFLRKSVELLAGIYNKVKVIVTVSPIRYAKYGFHGSALSKAVLLLAADRLAKEFPHTVTYFPAYEIVNDELRDYRFYAADMLHPSQQAVDYIWEVFSDKFFSQEAKSFIAEWRPVKQALAHKPFRPESEEYKRFSAETEERLEALKRKWNFSIAVHQ